MSKVSELKRKLEEAEKQEKLNAIDKELSNMKKQCGKGYASHSLNTYMNSGKESFNFQMLFVKDAVIKHKKPVYEIDIINVRKRGEGFYVNFEETSFYDKIPFYLGTLRYDVTQEQLNTFKKSFIPKLEKAIDELRFDYKAGNLVSQGDSWNLKNQYQLLKDIGKTFMKLDDKHHRVWELLRWNNHPYVFNEFLLKSKESFDIIKNISDKMFKDACSWGGSIYQRDMPRVEELNKFYNKYYKDL